jgi:hypothetical protein
MKECEVKRKDRIVVGIVCLPVGVFFLVASFFLIYRFVMNSSVDLTMAALAAFCMIIASGILHFVYLIASGKSETQNLGNGILSLSSISCILVAAVCLVLLLGLSAVVARDVSITLHFDEPQWGVSEYLTGAHFVYAYEEDWIYEDNTVIEWMKRARVGFIRYPGGTVTIYWHWNDLDGYAFPHHVKQLTAGKQEDNIFRNAEGGIHLLDAGKITDWRKRFENITHPVL